MCPRLRRCQLDLFVPAADSIADYFPLHPEIKPPKLLKFANRPNDMKLFSFFLRLLFNVWLFQLFQVLLMQRIERIHKRFITFIGFGFAAARQNHELLLSHKFFLFSFVAELGFSCWVFFVEGLLKHLERLKPRQLLYLLVRYLNWFFFLIFSYFVPGGVLFSVDFPFFLNLQVAI